jgi:hypothetical protein
MTLLLVGLAACGTNGGATTTQPQSTTSTPETTTTLLASESIFGWLQSFEGTAGAVTISVDVAEMLTGEEALAAAREAGAIGEFEDLPNDFYIRNPDESTIDLTVSPNVVVTLQACYEGGECVTSEQVDLDTWSVLLGGEDDPGLEWDWYGSGTLPYDFTVQNGVVVEIEEQYLP